MKYFNKKIYLKGGNEMTIGEKIKSIANEKDISIYRIAKDSGVSNSYLSELINNKRRNPSIEIIKKISKVLETPLEKLI